MIITNLHRNADMAKQIVARAIPQIPAEPDWPCHSALKNAILTEKKLWPKETVTELKPILAKYL
jgi:5'-methylthioadenosine phosphorylase